MKLISFSKGFKSILFAYIASLSCINFFDWPIFGSKVQVPECLFLILIIWIVLNIKEFISWKFYISIFDIILFSYPISVFISALFSINYHPFLELLGLLYLYTLYFFSKTYFYNHSKSILPFFIHSLVLMGIIASLGGLIGGILNIINVANPFSYTFYNFPYLGDTIRLTGFTSTPHMFATILSLSILALISKSLYGSNKKSPIIPILLLVFLLTYVFTFAKIIIVLIVAALYILQQKVNIKILKNIITSISVSLFILFIVATHWLIFDSNKFNIDDLKKEHFLSGRTYQITPNYHLIPTVYTSLKKTSLLLGKIHFPFGVGLGNNEIFIQNLKSQSLAPNNIDNFSPHSTYWGAWGETGVLGLISVLTIFFYLLFHTLTFKPNQPFPVLSTLFVAYLIFVTMEAISADVMNFRHLWIMFSLYAIIYKQPPKIQNPIFS